MTARQIGSHICRSSIVKMNVIIFGMAVENISHYSVISASICLHIHNWFDISQSLLLAAIGLIFLEHWNHFFSHFYIFFSDRIIASQSISSRPHHHCNFARMCLAVSILLRISTQKYILYISYSPLVLCFYFVKTINSKLLEVLNGLLSLDPSKNRFHVISTQNEQISHI